MVPTMTALRTALRMRLVGDPALVVLLGGPAVFHRFVRMAVQVPSVTYMDTAFHPYEQLPRVEASFTLDVWAHDLDAAEAIAARVATLLDQTASAEAGLAPMPTPGLNVCALHLASQRDTIEPDPTIVRKTLQFNVLAFDLVAAVA